MDGKNDLQDFSVLLSRDLNLSKFMRLEVRGVA